MNYPSLVLSCWTRIVERDRAIIVTIINQTKECLTSLEELLLLFDKVWIKTWTHLKNIKQAQIIS